MYSYTAMRVSSARAIFSSRGHQACRVSYEFVLVAPQLGGFVLERIAAVADAGDHLAHLIGRHAVAAGESFYLVVFIGSHAGAVGATHKTLIVGHLDLLIDGLEVKRMGFQRVPGPGL